MTPTTGGTASVWRPLRTPIFRQLLIANVASDIGTFMQSVGAAWLMVSMGAGPLFVALTQTASTLPFFVFALPAGAIGDIVDRRKLILYTEAWMTCMAIVLAVTTLAGVITPWLLLALTFALSAGDAIETPSWRAVLPELVLREDLAAASALNGIEFNIARAVGRVDCRRRRGRRLRRQRRLVRWRHPGDRAMETARPSPNGAGRIDRRGDGGRAPLHSLRADCARAHAAGGRRDVLRQRTLCAVADRRASHQR
jgi:hypothetical protein